MDELFSIKWSDEDLKLVAKWYGIDPEELLCDILERSSAMALRDNYCATVWGYLDGIAMEIAGAGSDEQVTEPFDFHEAYAREHEKAMA